jgi:hypothetical protein
MTICEKCGKESNYSDGWCGHGISLFDKLIFLCKDCDDDWGKIFDKSGVKSKLGGFSQEYQEAYHRLFMNWFLSEKEVVQFT